ncbi:mitogen-activated protein kinase kinase kinase 2-like [Saccoglossus kowalevskii]|uniref:Mitogen-activated protein kinase kinase kinase 2-like n=1 Tax=Saccoglossus kowalevskii TaxID=10224 RepID=A0ABM0M814_SACKO|nr:PREDICTED: mitogen-activated protein kinase kinase kinase 2-like [Saccoglossus kowalevskii]
MADATDATDQVLQDIKANLAAGYLDGGGRHKTLRGSSPNDVRVKFEYLGEKRNILVSRPVKFTDLLSKAKTAYGAGLTLVLHYSNNEFIIPVTSQSALDQAIELMDRVPRSKGSKALRLYLTTSGESRPSVSSTPPNGPLKDLFDTHISNNNSSKSIPVNRSYSLPQDIPEKGLESNKRHSAPPHQTRDTHSPPPGITPDSEEMPQASSFDSSCGEGRFIPEEDSRETEYRYDSQSSLVTTNYRTGGSLGSATGRSFRMGAKSNSHEDFSLGGDAFSNGDKVGKGGTYPRIHKQQQTYMRDYGDGRRTFPSRHQPAPSPAPLRRDQFSPQGSGSLSKSSNSSGIGPDIELERERRNSDLQNIMRTLQEINLKENAKSPRAPENWRRGRLMGQGAFGQVYVCYDADTGRELAVKLVQLERENCEARREVKALKVEIELLKNLHHERIVQYFGCGEDEKMLCIFMEMMPGGSVKDEIKQYGELTEVVVKKYTKQILEGAAYLHSNHIVHRDIKGANILRDAVGNVKLADFGASKRLQTICTLNGMKSVTGTPYWMSPEVINGEGYGRKADVWSIGCTVVEMFTKNPPWSEFEAMAAIFKIATQQTSPELPLHVSDDARNFIWLIFNRNTQERPSAEELLMHRFVLNSLIMD